MLRTLSASALFLALALPASAQTTRHAVTLGISPILAFSVATESVALVDGADAPLGFAYTTNLPSPHLSFSLNGTLPDGVALRVSTSDGSAAATVDRPGTVEFVLAGKAARHDHLVVGMTGRLASSSVTVPVTLTLHDDTTGLMRIVERELVLDSIATN